MLTLRIGLCLAAMWATFAMIVVETRQHAWHEATMFATDVASLLETAIAREFEVYDLSVRALAADAVDPEIMALSPLARRTVLFDRSANASDLGLMVVLDRAGRAVAMSRETAAAGRDFSDRDYFKVQRDDPSAGLYVGGPFAGRITGQPSIGLSRRIVAKDGTFAGVAVGTIKLSFFRTLFGGMHLPPDSSVTLMKRDGTILMRTPFRDDYIGRNVMNATLDDALSHGDGLYRRISGTDGVDRLFAVKQVRHLPFFVTVGMPSSGILANWRWEMLIIGVGFGILSAIIVLLGLNLGGELQRRGEAETRLAGLASTDYLTLLANRRRFDEVLETEWRRCARARVPLALLMVDCDYFKSFNDTYGHIEGDRVLRALGTALRACVHRPGDMVARYGGEEFAVLLPSVGAAGAAAVGAAVCAAVEAMNLVHAAAPAGRLTVSIGGASRTPDLDRSPFSLVEAADEALYLAKNEGRDRVAMEGDDVTAPRRVA